MNIESIDVRMNFFNRRSRLPKFLSNFRQTCVTKEVVARPGRQAFAICLFQLWWIILHRHQSILCTFKIQMDSFSKYRNVNRCCTCLLKRGNYSHQLERFDNVYFWIAVFGLPSSADNVSVQSIVGVKLRLNENGDSVLTSIFYINLLFPPFPSIFCGMLVVAAILCRPFFTCWSKRIALSRRCVNVTQ